MASAAPPTSSPPTPLGVAAVAASLVLLVALSFQPSKLVQARAVQGGGELDPDGTIHLKAGAASLSILASPTSTAQRGDLGPVLVGREVALPGVHFGITIDNVQGDLKLLEPRLASDNRAQAEVDAVVETATRSWTGVLRYELLPHEEGAAFSFRLQTAEVHRVALSLHAELTGHTIFARDAGFLADSGEWKSPVVLLEGGARLLLGSFEQSMDVRLAPDREHGKGERLAITLFSPEATAPAPAQLFLLAGGSALSQDETAGHLRHEPTKRISGRVVGTSSDVQVFAVGDDGRPLGHVHPDRAGEFALSVPQATSGLYAMLAHTRASPIRSLLPGETGPFELNLLPGGELIVRVSDLDTHERLTARVIVHGVPPTADPNFGPDYRATGAGPLLDALRGDAQLPLPAGRYRVRATRGPEFTIDEQMVEVAPGGQTEVALLLRHVIDSRGEVGCDLHVHARPSFDSPVLVEDRVLSLVAAGVDFAVPSEHNEVGHYDAALAALDLTHQLASVPGVEITTAHPSHGHFNVFPYDDKTVPPFQGVSVKHLFAAARGKDPARVLQVNHPRFGGIGYFDTIGLDAARAVGSLGEFRSEFDSLEVYNGHDGAHRARVEMVLTDWLALLQHGLRYVGTGDSDSHKIQYQWAGYPRTYVQLPPEQAGDSGGPIDVTALVASLKKGRVFVTSGPFIELHVGNATVGDTVHLGATASSLMLHVRVEAAPWVDTSEVEIFAGNTSVLKLPLEETATKVGKPQGSLEEAQRETIRFERDVEVALPADARFIVVVVRGSRPMDDVLPYMPIQPLAFTNPIWITREEFGNE